MAYQRTLDTKAKGDSLDVFIENIGKTYDRQIVIRNAEDEVKFNRLVLEQNIPLESQLSYRQEQLKRTTDDKDERKRLNSEISTLKDRIEQKNYTDDYLNKLVEFESGVTSVDSILQWLRDRKSSTTDQTIIDSINKQITEKESLRYNLVKNTIENETKYATESREVSIIENQIKKVTDSRNKALFAGDDLLVSSYDLQLQTLKKSKNETSIQKDLTSFAVAAVSGYLSATSLLDSYNSKIAASPQDGPVTINGTTYNSAREFWNYKRDTYLADNSANGFFSQFKQEIDNKVKVENSKNNLTESTLTNTVSAYNSLSSRQELQPYADQIAIYKQDSIQAGANLVADSIYNKYLVDYDINNAISGLTSLKALGVNISDTYTKVLQTGSQIKTSQVSNILTVANDLVASGMTPEEAVSKAIAQGAGATVSPEQAATKTEGELAGGFAKGFKEESFATDPRTTVSPATQAAAAPAAGGLKSYEYVDAAGKLQTVQAGSPEEAMAKAVNRAPNSGVQLKTGTTTPAATTAPKTTAPAPTTSSPVPAASPVPQQPTTTSTGGYVKVGGSYFLQTAPGSLKVVNDQNTIKQLQSGQLKSTTQTSLGSNKLIY